MGTTTMRKLTKLTQWAATAATLVGVAVVAPVVTAAPASAAGYGCAGNLVYTKSVYANRNGYTNKIGTVQSYYDGTYNCSVFVKSAYVGTPTQMNFSIYKEDDGTFDDDTGAFSQYAGPVRIKAPGSCVSEMLVMDNPSGTQIFFGQAAPPHNCG
ncbi:hypothetical protein ACH4NS_22480 [Streptomyces mutabilis]|jgi:hypothetical protein|uniref:hypothetical protein n=1 Tax=Streptomyces TaxID=1883 RepID=UPI000A23DFAA|nr:MULTISPECIES: hypothetical protein [unclassified Streptomyces]OSC73421.1 hypothetical protein B5181_00405 [Streptomyces sp. 4F]MDN3245862.1 hypothetical protein [Streptomyces sp. ZSW22]MDN3255452.1 hypothetical protein [Streptomyces sp. MA25(2023)]MDQ0387414.1 hypothetical protein [Streptomyces sp. DSM 42143]PAK23321.1 hypothetical protein CJD44_29625 [Streptomyces sp. alain-838]